MTYRDLVTFGALFILSRANELILCVPVCSSQVSVVSVPGGSDGFCGDSTLDMLTAVRLETGELRKWRQTMTREGLGKGPVTVLWQEEIPVPNTSATRTLATSVACSSINVFAQTVAVESHKRQTSTHPKLSAFLNYLPSVSLPRCKVTGNSAVKLICIGPLHISHKKLIELFPV